MGTSRRAEALALLGLARRAGAVVKGTDATRKALRVGEVRLVIVAQDAAEAQRRKVLPLAEARGVSWTVAGTKEELGLAVGAGPLTAVGVTETGLAEVLQERLGRD
jgi:ribosomal protein L7Ae-like RNA K-turn-binding protein